MCNFTSYESSPFIPEDTSTTDSFHNIQHNLQEATVQVHILPSPSPSYNLHPKTQLLLLVSVRSLLRFCPYSGCAARWPKDLLSCIQNVSKPGIFSRWKWKALKAAASVLTHSPVTTKQTESLLHILHTVPAVAVPDTACKQALKTKVPRTSSF